jgi:hypothetical protein
MEFRLLGPLEVRDGERSVALGGERQRALLALLLACEPGRFARAVDRRVVGRGAPGNGGDDAAGVRVAVAQAARLGRTGDASARLPAHRRAGVDRPAPLRVSLTDGREALAGGDPEQAARTLHEALELWRGPALAEFTSEPFARIEAQRLDDLRIAAIEERIEADLALGRHIDLVGELGG